MESEYIALSSTTRELLPLRRILQDIVTHSFIQLPTNSPDTIASSTFKLQLKPSRIYEDNAACVVLSTTDLPQFKPRTKHISLKYHHFCDQVLQGILQIIKVDTQQNWADIFKKPSSRVKFEYLWHLMMGW